MNKNDIGFRQCKSEKDRWIMFVDGIATPCRAAICHSGIENKYNIELHGSSEWAIYLKTIKQPYSVLAKLLIKLHNLYPDALGYPDEQYMLDLEPRDIRNLLN